MKDFLLIASQNIITYKNVFPLIKDGIIAQSSQVKTYENTDKTFGNHYWYTTLLVRHKRKLILTATYDPEKYPKYDNYPEAINVDRIKDIPYDYDGIMGVPITIFAYDLDNVKIQGLAAGSSAKNGFGDCANYQKHPKDKGGAPILMGKVKYVKVLIKIVGCQQFRGCKNTIL